MNDIYSLSTVVLAHGLHTSVGSGVWLLIVMSLFVFGLLLCRKFVRIPKGLFISSVISCILVLINILQFSFELQIPEIVGNPCFMVVIYPAFFIIHSIDFLFDSTVISVEGNSVFLIAFFIDTLCIFAIIRLILYINHKGSAKKPQVKQAV